MRLRENRQPCLRAPFLLLGRFFDASHAELLSGTVGSVVVRGAAVALGVLVPLVLGRLLGAAGYGTYAYASAWALLIGSVGAFGLDIVAIRELAAARTRGAWNEVRAFSRWAARAVVFVALLALTLAYIGALLACSRLEPRACAALRIALLGIPAIAAMRLLEGFAQGLGRVVLGQIPQQIVLPGAVVLAAAAIFCFTGQLSARRVAVAYVGAAVAAASVGMVIVRGALADGPAAPRGEPRKAQWLRAAIPLFLSVLVALLNDSVGVLVLGTFVSTEAAGVYDVARRAATLVALPLVTVNMALGPIVSARFAEGDTVQLRRSVRFGARLALAGALPIALCLVFFGEQLLRILGADFAGGRLPLLLVVAGQLFNVAAGSVGLILNMTGHERDTLRGILAGTTTNALLTVLLAPRYGAVGAAGAAAASFFVWNTFMALRVWAQVGINPTAFARIGPAR